MTDECRFVPVLLRNRNLPLSGTTIQSGEDFSRTEKINTLFHARDGVGVPDGYRIELAIIHAKPQHPIRFRELKPRGCPGGLSRLNNAIREHSIDLLLLSLAGFGPSAVWRRRYWPSALSKIDMIGGGRGLPEGTIPHRRERH